ncbi:MAG: 5-(carboxyamino)imidazole ribonucleotide mutase [Candidatus Margulisbacteria bacterium]|nr:5-(carboxyamino)imidazole ribonucleotide mutase [Candidatus Margulisiibacteriota bacterium]
MKDVLVIMGSNSDMPVMQECIDTLEKFGLSCQVEVASAHRTPEKVLGIAKDADKKFKVIIAAAGKSAHLPGVIAGHTILPVIGVPMKTSDLGGVDSLYSIVQMPKGVPVATVAINGAMNSAILAAQMIGISNSAVKEKLLAHKEEMKNS